MLKSKSGSFQKLFTLCVFCAFTIINNALAQTDSMPNDHIFKSDEDISRTQNSDTLENNINRGNMNQGAIRDQTEMRLQAATSCTGYNAYN